MVFCVGYLVWPQKREPYSKVQVPSAWVPDHGPASNMEGRPTEDPKMVSKLDSADPQELWLFQKHAGQSLGQLRDSSHLILHGHSIELKGADEEAAAKSPHLHISCRQCQGCKRPTSRKDLRFLTGVLSCPLLNSPRIYVPWAWHQAWPWLVKQPDGRCKMRPTWMLRGLSK